MDLSHELYTSWFCRNWTKHKDITCISIARSTPAGVRRHIKGELIELAPSYSLLRGYKNGTISAAEYRRQYQVQLDKLDPKQVLARIHALANTHKVALLCWERPGDFCHRTMVAKWLAQVTGKQIPEL